MFSGLSEAYNLLAWNCLIPVGKTNRVVQRPLRLRRSSVAPFPVAKGLSAVRENFISTT